jgi:hypothetical protein
MHALLPLCIPGETGLPRPRCQYGRCELFRGYYRHFGNVLNWRTDNSLTEGTLLTVANC